MTAQTTTERQAKRRQKLNEIAQQAGYKTWGKFETATIEKGKIEMKKTMLIKAEKQENGKFILIAENGTHPQDNFEYNGKLEAYNAAMQLWPANSVWHGCMTHEGYRIEI